MPEKGKSSFQTTPTGAKDLKMSKKNKQYPRKILKRHRNNPHETALLYLIMKLMHLNLES